MRFVPISLGGSPLTASASCCASPAMPPADCGMIRGPGRRGPQEGHPTPARNQGQRGGETEKKRIEGFHNIDFLQTLRFCYTWALLRPHVSIKGHKITHVGAARCSFSAMCDNLGTAVIPLRTVAIMFSLLYGQWLQ
jgi:hypothetical protein